MTGVINSHRCQRGSTYINGKEQSRDEDTQAGASVGGGVPPHKGDDNASTKLPAVIITDEQTVEATYPNKEEAPPGESERIVSFKDFLLTLKHIWVKAAKEGKP